MVCVILSVGGMVHIKVPLLLIGKSSPYGGSVFPLLLLDFWSGPLLYVCQLTLIKSVLLNEIFPSFLHL